MDTLTTLWERWVRWTERPVDPRPLALLRILVAGILLLDVARVALLGLLPWMLVPLEAGGLAAARPDAWWRLGSALGDDVAGYVLFAGLVVGLVGMLLGVVYRPAVLLAVFCHAQLGFVFPPGDRAAAAVSRTVLLLMCFVAADRAWSLRSRREGPARSIASWPVDALRLLLVVIYLNAGIVKVVPELTWLQTEGISPVFKALTQPMTASLSAPDSLWAMPAFWALSWGTIAMELSSPLLLFRRTRALWAPFGMALHLGLWATVSLGIFCPLMLSLYLVVLPDPAKRLCDWLEDRIPGPGAG